MQRVLPATPGRQAFAAVVGFLVITLVTTIVLVSGHDDRVVTRGDDAPPTTADARRSSSTTPPPEVSRGNVSFATAPLTNGATVDREWSIDADTKTFTGSVKVANPLTTPTSTFHVEVIPKAIATSSSLIEMTDGGPQFTVIKDDPVIAWDLDLEPEQTIELRFVVRNLLGIPDDETLARLAEEATATAQTESTARLASFCAVRTCVTATTAAPVDETATPDAATPDTVVPVGSPAPTVAVAPATTTRPGTVPGLPPGVIPTAPPSGGTVTSTLPPATTPSTGAPPVTVPVSVPAMPQTVLARDPVNIGATCPAAGAARTRFTVAWAPPASNGGGTIGGYVITVAEKGKPSNAYVKSVSGSTLSVLFDVTDPVSGAAFETTVRAVNSAGLGAPGVATAVVPDVVGQCVAEGAALARALGLVLTTTDTVAPDPALVGQIWQQDTAVGAQLPPGASLLAQAYS